MNALKAPPGWANPRALPFVGWRINLTRLHQLYGIKVGQRRARGNGGSTLDFPPIIQLQTKSGCNASCVFCPQREIKDLFPPAAMTDELFRRVVEQCAVEPNFHGMGFVLQNEPLTDEGIYDKIRLFRDSVSPKAMAFLVTNGTLLTPENGDRIIASGLDAMHISCNGLGKEDFEAVNEGKSWDVFSANLEAFLARDLSKIGVMMSFVRSNLYRGELDRAIAQWRARGLRCFVHGINNRGGLVKDFEKYARPMDLEPWPVRFQKRFMQWFIGCCPYPFIQMSVLASGKVIVCTHDWQRKTVVGDLNERSIRDVWNGPEMRDVRLRLLQGRGGVAACEGCDVFTNATFV